MKIPVSVFFLTAALFVQCFTVFSGENQCFLYAEEPFTGILKERVRIFAEESPEYRVSLGSSLEKEQPVFAVSEKKFPEKEYDSVPLAFCGTAIVASRVNSIENLTESEARDLVSGKVKVWKEAGVPLKKIYVVNGVLPIPVPGSKGPQVIFAENGRTAGILLGEDPAAVVLLPFDCLRECGAGTRIMTVNGAKPEPDAVLSGKYPLVKFYYLSCRKGAPPGIRSIWDDMRSPAFRRVLLRFHLLPLPEEKKN